MIEFNATFLVAMISFVVFMLIMNAIFYEPVLNMMRKREDYVNSNYQDAEMFTQKTQNCIQEHDEKLEKAKIQNSEELTNTLETIQKQAFDKTLAAKEEAKIQIQAQKDSLENEKKLLTDKIDLGVIPELSESVIEKIVGEKL